MKFGFVLPRGDARTAAEYAREVEQAGWDGFFVWEAVYGSDPWVSLSAAAMVTERIRLGTMLTPLPALQPWQIAAISAALDRLSNGRLILSVGLGGAGYRLGGVGAGDGSPDPGLSCWMRVWRSSPGFAANRQPFSLRWPNTITSARK